MYSITFKANDKESLEYLRETAYEKIPEMEEMSVEQLDSMISSVLPPDKTTEVCAECGSEHIGYDAWVKLSPYGTVDVVGGPFDESQCLNEYCEEKNPSVRNVNVVDIEFCRSDGCDFNGDKEVMQRINLFMTDDEQPTWYCSACVEEHKKYGFYQEKE